MKTTPMQPPVQAPPARSIQEIAFSVTKIGKMYLGTVFEITNGQVIRSKTIETDDTRQVVESAIDAAQHEFWHHDVDPFNPRGVS